MNQYVQPFLHYLAASPTAFHAVEQAKRQLLAAGYACLNEQEAYGLKAGGRYFVTRNQSSLIAFRVPAKGLAPFRITASHVDSPAFKLKARMEDRSVKPYTRLNAEKYGGANVPVSKHAAATVLTLPMYADLTVEDADRICDGILKE